MLHHDQVERLVRFDCGADVALVDEARTGGGDRQRRFDAVAVCHRQPHHCSVALQVGLLIDGEESDVIFDVGFDLGTEIKGAVNDLACAQAGGIQEGVEGVGAGGSEGEVGVNAGVGGVEVADGGLGFRRIALDGEHLGSQVLLGEGIGEAAAAGIETDVSDLVVDADALGGAGVDHAQTAEVAALVLIHTEVGEVGDAVDQRTGTGVVGNDGDAGIKGAGDGVLEEHRVADGEGDAVGVGGDRLVDQSGCLFEVEFLRTQHGDLDAHIFGSVGDAVFNHAPERVPGAQGVLHQDEVQRFLLRRFDHFGFLSGRRGGFLRRGRRRRGFFWRRCCRRARS